jgi:hypothetical protein
MARLAFARRAVGGKRARKRARDEPEPAHPPAPASQDRGRKPLDNSAVFLIFLAVLGPVTPEVAGSSPVPLTRDLRFAPIGSVILRTREPIP